MSMVGFKAKNHPQQVRAAGRRDEIDDRAVHPTDFAAFNERYGPFTVDVAAAAHNARCDHFYDRDSDGLAQDWAGERVWCNPPYSNIAPWIRKAWECWETTEGITMLLPGNRAEQSWWQQMVEPYRDRANSPLTSEFLPGRLRFLKRGQTSIGANERPLFGCVLLHWRPVLAFRDEQLQDVLPIGGTQ